MAHRHMIDEWTLNHGRAASSSRESAMSTSRKLCIYHRALAWSGLKRLEKVSFDKALHRRFRPLENLPAAVMLLVEVILENHREADFEAFSGRDP